MLRLAGRARSVRPSERLLRYEEDRLNLLSLHPSSHQDADLQSATGDNVHVDVSVGELASIRTTVSAWAVGNGAPAISDAVVPSSPITLCAFGSVWNTSTDCPQAPRLQVTNPVVTSGSRTALIRAETRTADPDARTTRSRKLCWGSIGTTAVRGRIGHHWSVGDVVH